jgi:hypothetical protein
VLFFFFLGKYKFILPSVWSDKTIKTNDINGVILLGKLCTARSKDNFEISIDYRPIKETDTMIIEKICLLHISTQQNNDILHQNSSSSMLGLVTGTDHLPKWTV